MGRRWQNGTTHDKLFKDKNLFCEKSLKFNLISFYFFQLVTPASSSEEHTMLCWGNFSLFDFRGRLAAGRRVALNLWGAVPR